MYNIFHNITSVKTNKMN